MGTENEMVLAKENSPGETMGATGYQGPGASPSYVCHLGHYLGWGWKFDKLLD